MSQTQLTFVHTHEEGSRPLTLLLLHGTGGDEQSLIPIGRQLAPDARLLSPRGKVLENGSQTRFFRRLAEGVFDIEDLIFRTHELADFVQAASVAYGFALTSVVAVGYSNGANIAGALLLLRPEVLAGALLLRPMVPLLPDTLPELANRPVFIAAGERDELITQDQPEALAALLRRAGADVTLRWEPGTHKLTRPELDDAAGWLRTHWGEP
jgi:predicted esterase